MLKVCFAHGKLLEHLISAKAGNWRKAEWGAPMHPEPAGPTTLEPRPRPAPSFAISFPPRMSIYILGQSQLPLYEAWRSPSPRVLEGAPLDEVSNRSQQTALLPRPGSWKPQGRPLWREPALSWAEGSRGRGAVREDGSEGALGWVPSLAPRTLCCLLAPGGPEVQENCRERSPGKVGKDWSWIPQCPYVFFAGCRMHVRDTSWCSVGPLASPQPLLEPTLLLTPSECLASELVTVAAMLVGQENSFLPALPQIPTPPQR